MINERKNQARIAADTLPVFPAEVVDSTEMRRRARARNSEVRLAIAVPWLAAQTPFAVFLRPASLQSIRTAGYRSNQTTNSTS